MKLHDGLLTELRLLDRDPRHGSSDRQRDRARASLKRKGLIRFDRKDWTWVITDAGRAALEEDER